MKKMITLVLALMMLMLAACGKKVNEPVEINQGTETTPVVEEVATEEPVSGVVDNPFDEELDATEATEEDVVVRDPDESSGLLEPDEEDDPASATKPSVKPTEPTKPTEPSTKPTEPADKPSTGNGSGNNTSSSGEMSYEKLQSMSAAEQQAYMNSFGSIDEFFAWYNAAKEEYDSSKDEIEVGNGSINMGDIINGGN